MTPWGEMEDEVYEEVEPEEAEVELCYTSTNEMYADFLTKNLARPKFEHDVMALKLHQYDDQGKILEYSKV